MIDLPINRSMPSRVYLCEFCFTPYRKSLDKDKPTLCPLCGDNEDFANGYLCCWYDQHVKREVNHS